MNDRKVAIVFREIPNEPHMCLVTYTETLNAHIHDPLMRTIESDIGQNSENLADALNRSYTQDGKIILQVLHHEGLLKKVQTSQVVVTPNPSTKIKLDELNKILDEMKQGEQAVQRLAEMDNSRGMQNPVDVARRMRPDAPANIPAVDGIIGDTQLAQQRLQQAQKMESEARGLLAEAKRLTEEAQTMDPTLNNVHVATLAPAPKKRGRPAKAKVTV